MITLARIREDLREIRYYYIHKSEFDENVKIIGANEILKKAERYHTIMRSASPLLFNLYAGLYIRGNTQEGLAVELGYSSVYIQMQNKKLLLYLQSKLSGETL